MVKKKKGILWKSLRIVFYMIVGIWIFFILFPTIDSTTITRMILAYIWVISGVYVFIASIIHLTQYKEKSFAITSLIISTILIVLFMIGLLSGLSEMKRMPGEMVQTDSRIQLTNPVKQPTYNLKDIEQKIHNLVNKKREEKNLSILRWDEHLAEISRKHSQDMAQNNFLGHIDSNGKDVEYRYRASGYTCKIPIRKGEDDILYITGLEDVAYHPIAKYIYTDTGEVAEYYTEDEITENVVEEWGKYKPRDTYTQKAYEITRAEGIGLAMSEKKEIYVTQSYC